MILDNSAKSDRILDIGCSDGKILKELLQRDYTNLYGIDIQEWAKTSLVGTKIKYQDCDIEKEPIPFRGKFDVIVLSDVLEHLFSPQTVLYDIRTHLAPKGKVVFGMPNAGWFLNGLLLTFFPSKLFVSTAFGPWGHTHQFTFFEVKKIAKSLKYKILTLKGGKLDNYAFKAGFKKILFDGFALVSQPLIQIAPIIFSAHIFGVWQITRQKVAKSARFDLGL